MACPQCGQRETVLQAVTSPAFECRAELGGCGATFESLPSSENMNAGELQQTLDAMLEAIAVCEALEPDSPATQQLLSILRQHIAHISTLLHT
jgi:hypothetical protein